MSSRPDRPSDVPTPEPAPRRGRRLRFRVDAGSVGGDDLAPGRGSLLTAFHIGTPDRTSSTSSAIALERRGAMRHYHVECLAWVGWRIWRGFAMSDAVLVNLSRNGARVFLDRIPPRGRDLWLFLETPDHKAIVKTRLLDLEATSGGQCAVRIEFREPCPYALFEAAVCGLHSSDPKTRLARVPHGAAPRPAARRQRSAPL
jgi:hypothetical protein